MTNDSPAVSDDSGGSLRALLHALREPLADTAALAVVVATEGSTYRKAGALILLPERGARVGWLSGGCLEAELDAAAAEVRASGGAKYLRLDTRSDDDLVFGSASGCRGVVELMVLPLVETAPLLAALRDLDRDGTATLQLELYADGSGHADDGAQRRQWPATSSAPDGPCWSVRLCPPRRLLLLGAGPESPPLLRLAHLLGWRVDVVESRARWFGALATADAHYLTLDALGSRASGYDAAVVMSHHYSRDREFLRFCVDSETAWIGLLGPVARRDALLAELDATTRERLVGRLHAPVGLRLGGEGPETIALAIVAALQRDGNRQ